MIGALVLGLSAAPPAAAAQPAQVRADLDGRPIPAAQAVDHFCTDAAFPLIHCYSTPAALEAAAGVTAPAPLAAAATEYVVVYSGQGYSGNYMRISQNWDALAAVGWNDRIRSYRALNGLAGTFYTDWYGGGSVLQFCCGVTAPSLSTTFDAQISSVYQR